MSERPRRRPARRQVLCDPAVFPLTSHFPAQGTGRAQEVQFREHLRQFCQAWEEVLDPLVWEALMDHLYRTDGNGASLCFAGPLRTALFEEVRTWLATQAQALRTALLPEWEALEALGNHTHDGTWNEVPAIIRMPLRDAAPLAQPPQAQPRHRRQGDLFT